MRKGSLIKYKCLSLLIIIFSLNLYSAQCSTNLPLNHWAYSDLERLAAFGLVDTEIIGTKPFSRLEIARLIVKANERREGENVLIDHILKRLKKEFRHELETIEEGSTQSIFYKLVDTIRFKYTYLKGNHPSTFSYIRLNDIKGTSLWYNNDGITYKEDNNLIIDFYSRVELSNLLSFYYQPILTKNSEDTEIEIHKVYLKFMLGKFELQVGKDSNWWGQGYHGNLILTNNAEPLKFIKLSNPIPILLPWKFSYLGPFKSVFLISKLEKERAIPNPLLIGLRVNFKPYPLLELGTSGIIMAEGEGRPRLILEDIWDIIRIKHPYRGKEDVTNQIMVLDGRLRIPYLRNTEIYGEYGAEDTGLKLFGLGDMAYLLGVYIPRLTDDGKTKLRIEYADTIKREFGTGLIGWYSHGVYRSGYTYKGKILGHHMGGSSQDTYLQIQRYLKEGLVLTLEFDYEIRGVGEKMQEIHQQSGMHLSYDINDKLKIKGRYGYEDIKNFNFVKDNRENNRLAEVSLVTTF
ncbi:MAG: capsule assembly Wzi family protein [bacterium]|nr:capsule assembly Wzi family protein [bacterium]